MDRAVQEPSVTQNVLPDKLFKRLAELPHVANELKSRRIKEAHWLPVADQQLLQPPRTLVEQVCEYLLKHGGADLPPTICGLEWWVHSRPANGKMHMHFDRDEGAWEEETLMRHPLLSSVLYIGDIGGPTLIVDQQCDETHSTLCPEVAEAGTLFEVASNCWATFDGSLLHGVCNTSQCNARCDDLELDDTGVYEEEQDPRRVTLLVNFWDSEIQNFEEMTHELTNEELWAYGEVVPHKLWSARNKRARELDPYRIGAEEVCSLYSYDMTGDQDTSDDGQGDEDEAGMNKHVSDSESSSEEEEADPRIEQLAEYIASGCSPEECAARLVSLGAKDALVGGGLCFNEEFSLAFFLICATILKGDLMEKIKECAPLLKHWCESRADVEEAHQAFLIALEMVIVQEKPTWITKYDDVLKQHWNYDVVPDEPIERWQNEEKALHKYCGHAWHLDTAIAVRAAGQKFVAWMLAGEDDE